MAHVREALDAWTPEIVRRNQVESLRRNDWRLRFAEIAEVVGVTTSTLERQHVRLEELMQRLEG